MKEFMLCTQAPESITPIHHHPKKEQRIPAATPLDFPALLPRRAKLTTKLPTAEPLRKAPHAMLTPRT